MRLLSSLVLAAVATTSLAVTPAEARRHDNRYYDGNRYYSSYDDCMRRRSRAAKRGTVIGAVGAGAGAAVLGGNLGESLLGAGVGAVAGNAIGRGSEKRCYRRR
ncbi:hypothetical protein KX816_16865 [Sphingosinicellaceae bacterium]|nr:hypothetical protein KX816_16865 [Sphingosinicellaceae bacterium]